MRITNYELRITNWKSAFRFLVVLCVLCVSAKNSFAQNTNVIQQQLDLLPYEAIFQAETTQFNIEKKRSALIEIRNFQTANASRIAVPALKDNSDIVRATAAAAVVFLPSVEAALNLIPLLGDKKPFVRTEAAYALGKVGDANAVNPLLQLLQKDKITEVRHAAVVALGEIGEVTAVSELVVILRRKPQAKEEFARRSAARSIGQIAQIIQIGKVAVLTPENFLPERFKVIEQPKYRKLIEEFPAFIAAINVLTQTLRNPQEFQDVRREAAFALGAIGDESAIAVLQSAANGEDYYLAEICRESLQKIHVAANR